MGNLFRENVREELEFYGISAKELSIKTNIPYQTLQNYLNSRGSMPPADYACRIARVLNTTVENLVGENQNKKSDAKTKRNALIINLFEKLKAEDKKAIMQLLESLSE